MNARHLLPVLAVAACTPAVGVSGFSRDVVREGQQENQRPADTVDVRQVNRSARGAQQRFERVRWSTLDFTWWRGGYDCHEIIGRFCLWYSEGEGTWEPPEEPDRLLDERDRLLAQLRWAASASPEDDWVRGQLVRYLVESGRHEEALAAARACGGQPWWCHAVTGFALHAAGDFASSEREFDSALALMPERERRRWTDLEWLLSAGDARAYRRMDDASRDSLERRFWWLSNPLYMVPGNERRTEHLSRYVLDRLLEDSRTQEQVSWGSDTRQILIRFGAPRGWERIRQQIHQPLTNRPVVSHYQPGSREFLPSFRQMRDVAAIPPDGWPVDVERPRTTYLPSYSDVFAELENQVAVFRRGGRALVVAAYELPADSVSATESVRAAIVRVADEHRPPLIVEQMQRGRRGVLSAELPAADALLSVEVLTSESERAARARHGVRTARIATAPLAISDILLLEDAEPPPEALDQAMMRARGAARARPGESIGLYWEVYGLGAMGEEIGIELSLREDRRRGGVARLLGLGRSPAAVDMRWREHASGPIWSRAVDVRLDDLPPGTYTVEVAIARSGEGRLRATRRLRIE